MILTAQTTPLLGEFKPASRNNKIPLITGMIPKIVIIEKTIQVFEWSHQTHVMIAVIRPMKERTGSRWPVIIPDNNRGDECSVISQ